MHNAAEGDKGYVTALQCSDWGWDWVYGDILSGKGQSVSALNENGCTSWHSICLGTARGCHQNDSG